MFPFDTYLESEKHLLKVSVSISDEKMVEKLRPDELASFREAFDTFDKSSDGTISTKVTLH